MNKQYFYARRSGKKTETRGSNKCFLGHKLHYDPQKKPDGIYAEWSWDNIQFIAENDRYGIHPLFYYFHNNEFCISPSIISLLNQGISGELDYTALSVFLRMGFFIGDDTPFKYVKALPPNTRLVWKNGKLDISTTPNDQKKQLHLSRQAAIDNYIDLFRQAIQRRAPSDEDFVIPLSGGRDSRHILLELYNLGYKPKFCTTAEYAFPFSNTQDVTVAQLVAQRLKIDHFIIRQDKSFFEAELKKNSLLSFCADEHWQWMALARTLKGKTKIIYDGLGGDVLSAGLFSNNQRLKAFETEHLAELAGSLLSENKIWDFFHHKTALDSIPSDEFQEKIDVKYALAHLTTELQKHLNAINPIASFFFWNRTRREIGLSPFAILSDIPTVYCPYLDHDLYDFLSSLDPALFLDHAFHTNTIQQAYPEFCNIPFQNKKAKEAPFNGEVRFIRSLFFYLFINMRHGTLVSLKYIFPRLIYSLFKKSYRKRFWYWACLPLALYLVELKKKSSQ